MSHSSVTNNPNENSTSTLITKNHKSTTKIYFEELKDDPNEDQDDD